MGSSVFLTGASGYLGSVLADHLAKLPDVDRITGVYNATTPAPSTSNKLDYIRMDIRSPDLVKAMAGHQIVIHSAFIVMWKAQSFKTKEICYGNQSPFLSQRKARAAIASSPCLLASYQCHSPIDPLGLLQAA